MKAKIIYNPVSGKQRFSSRIGPVVERLTGKGYMVEVYPTQKKGDGILAGAKACAEGIDLVISVGGDGTLSEIINGIGPSQHRPRVGIIPMGTSNDFASTLRIPRDVNKAMDIILDGEVVSFDIGRLNQRYFVYIAALGAFTRLTYTAPNHLKRLFGVLAYFNSIIQEIPVFFNPFRLCITTENEKYEGEYSIALIVNARDFAGIRQIIPEVKLNDGLFDILLIPKSSLKVITGLVRGLLVGIDKLEGFGILHFQANSFRVESDRKLRWNTDGERGGSGDAVIECLKQHLFISVPKEAAKKHFS